MPGEFVSPDIVPFMRYRDAPGAIEWLERALGFERVSVFEGEDGTIAHAVLRFGTAAIQLSSPASARSSVRRIRWGSAGCIWSLTTRTPATGERRQPAPRSSEN